MQGFLRSEYIRMDYLQEICKAFWQCIRDCDVKSGKDFGSFFKQRGECYSNAYSHRQTASIDLVRPWKSAFYKRNLSMFFRLLRVNRSILACCFGTNTDCIKSCLAFKDTTHLDDTSTLLKENPFSTIRAGA